MGIKFWEIRITECNKGSDEGRSDPWSSWLQTRIEDPKDLIRVLRCIRRDLNLGVVGI